MTAVSSPSMGGGRAPRPQLIPFCLGNIEVKGNRAHPSKNIWGTAFPQDCTTAQYVKKCQCSLVNFFTYFAKSTKRVQFS